VHSDDGQSAPLGADAKDAGASGAASHTATQHAGHRWIALVCGVVVLGVAGSLTAAVLWRSSVHARERETFQTSATDVAGTLQTLLRRDTDFVRAVRAVLAMQPTLSPSGFREWLTRLEERPGQQNGYGALVVRDVPASELASFESRRDTDPAFRALVAGHAEPVPVTGRSRYCLLAAGSANIGYTSELRSILQGDWCDPNSLIGGYRQSGTTRAQFTQAITDSGQYAVYSAMVAPGVSSLILEAAVYRRGMPAASVAERRAAVVGWVLGSFDISTLMRAAVGAHRRLAVTLYHRNGSLPPEYIASIDAGARSQPFVHHATLGVDGTWIITVKGAPYVSGPSADVQGAVVLVVGLIASALLCSLVVVLARSRERALGMVREKTRELEHLALHDALTGLPNRVVALDRAAQMLARARRTKDPVAALYIDLDGFKQVNDSLGHTAGDELLRCVADRLRTVVRAEDTAARLGGDEFVVLVEGSGLDAAPELVAERLRELLREPYEIASSVRPMVLSASVGIAYGLDGDAEQLVREADIALYQAKAAGRDRCAVFETGMETAIQDRLTLQMDITEALDRSQLFLAYQPIVELATERVVGVEALVRWRHPRRGVLSPAEFVPVAEASGLIAAIVRWTLREACAQCRRWQRAVPELRVSVNISPVQLQDERILNDVRQALTVSGIDAAALMLEVTETALMRDGDTTADRLLALKALGVSVAIDDFGTGYSSLAHLRELPADALKVDRSFVSGIASSTPAKSLVSMLIRLGRALDIETFAEGIEDRAQLEMLKHEGCRYGQGFLFARPLAVDAMSVFLAQARDRGPADEGSRRASVR
jgi:diguanylate cyclase (GGDEF)-like protein